MSAPEHGGRGIVTSIVGTVAGGVFLGAVGLAIAAVATIPGRAQPGEDVARPLGWMLAGAMAGLWAGGSLGCWFALKSRGHEHANTTGRYVSAAVPAVLVLTSALSGSRMSLLAAIPALVIAPALVRFAVTSLASRAQSGM